MMQLIVAGLTVGSGYALVALGILTLAHADRAYVLGRVTLREA